MAIAKPIAKIIPKNVLMILKIPCIKTMSLGLLSIMNNADIIGREIIVIIKSKLPTSIKIPSMDFDFITYTIEKINSNACPIKPKTPLMP